jgi:hypothetical protein
MIKKMIKTLEASKNSQNTKNSHDIMKKNNNFNEWQNFRLKTVWIKK